MGTTDLRVDAYIAAAAPFAQPILSHIRAMVHAHAADADEAIKWGFPHFVIGKHIVASMAAFKTHAAFGFWQGEAVAGDARQDGAMGSFGRLTSLADLPDDDELGAMIAKAAILAREGGVKRAPRAPKPSLPMPDDLSAAIESAPAVRAVWDKFPPSHRREYIEWVTGAKRDETRVRRVAQAVEKIACGEGLNAKYQR
jgi:uncharacterized protein YdeI (YjbR/CyaY-like superfamily)